MHFITTIFTVTGIIVWAAIGILCCAWLTLLCRSRVAARRQTAWSTLGASPSSPENE